MNIMHNIMQHIVHHMMHYIMHRNLHVLHMFMHITCFFFNGNPLSRVSAQVTSDHWRAINKQSKHANPARIVVCQEHTNKAADQRTHEYTMQATPSTQLKCTQVEWEKDKSFLAKPNAITN